MLLTGRTLAFDTSSRATSAALLEGAQVVAEQRHSPEAAGSSRLLVPTVQQLLLQQGWRFQALQQLVVTVGPGSFSGLRMGLVTAKLLAYANQLPIAGLNTLQVLAFRASQPQPTRARQRMIALLDAQRGELFAQPFLLDDSGTPYPEAPREILAAKDLANRFPEGLFTGSGLRSFAKAIASTPNARPIGNDADVSSLPAEIAARATSAELWDCTAAAAGQLAVQLGPTLPIFDCWNLLPDYGRPSAAEEKAIDRSRPSV
jgi:tRNA threonylcarbamoyladenosine biosynthesis protein TsaB